MSLFASRGRKALIALVAAGTLAGTVSITTSEANAWGGGWGWGHGYGYGAAAVAGGLALGAIAAGAAASPYYGGCYITHQRYIDGWGYEHFRRVRVCD